MENEVSLSHQPTGRRSASEKKPATTSTSAAAGTPPVTGPLRPSVFDYRDYRSFLADSFAFKKKAQPSYSASVFAKKAGISSHSLLGMVVRGERNLSSETLRGFGRALELTGPSMQYFERLVLFCQSKKLEDKSHYLQQMQNSLPPGHGARPQLKRLTDYTEYTSSMIHTLVRELVGCRGFRAEPEWIARRLKNRFSKNEVERAWGLLNRLGFIRQNEAGEWEQTAPILVIESNIEDPALSQFQLSYFEFSSTTVREEPRDDRELGFVAMAIEQKDIPAIKEKLREFRAELLRDFVKDKKTTDTVVTVGLQFFKTTGDENV